VATASRASACTTRGSRAPSILEALGLDTGAVIFALLGLALACRGRRATAERVLNVACALGSLTMNLLAAYLTSPRSVTVYSQLSAARYVGDGPVKHLCDHAQEVLEAAWP
jgi:hypothetical protein